MTSGKGSEQGFELTVDQPRRILRMRLWGMWDDATTAAFERDMLVCFRSLAGGPWHVLVDARQFPPQRESVTYVHTRLINIAITRGMRRAATIVHSAVSRMQASRVVEDSRLQTFSFHVNEARAVAWLLSGA